AGIDVPGADRVVEPVVTREPAFVADRRRHRPGPRPVQPKLKTEVGVVVRGDIEWNARAWRDRSRRVAEEAGVKGRVVREVVTDALVPADLEVARPVILAIILIGGSKVDGLIFVVASDRRIQEGCKYQVLLLIEIGIWPEEGREIDVRRARSGGKRRAADPGVGQRAEALNDLDACWMAEH